MKNIHIAIWLTVIFSLMGCTSKGLKISPLYANPVQAEINCAEIFHVSNRVATDKARTIDEAAHLGAFLGELITLFISRDDDKRLIGQILGGLAGAFVGNWVVMRKQRYANIENAINNETQIVTCQNESLRVENQKLKQDIEDYELQIVASKANKPSLQAQKKAVKIRYQDAKKMLAVVKNGLKEAKMQYHAHLNDDTVALKTWKTQVADLEKETKILQSHVDRLYSMIQGL
ncbi:hypothetical protein PN36_02270 [Candidatus Thiomargarita nelsonii]|uniref:Lipoprotein n=1 Tax=Candidatus Thiomargarita nelsonii TaxID=1003181 RepID=A0A0A6P7L0_9GAMM|nr:hypothetical protein PN36_02270 [Candidatus Thiomargarita nelsonii]